MSLEVQQKKVGEFPAIVITGRAVDVDVKKLTKAMDALYKKSSDKIILDVTNTDFVDSHGLGTIVYYHTLMQKERRELVILNTNPDRNSYLNRLFELTHLDKILKIFTEEKAVTQEKE